MQSLEWAAVRQADSYGSPAWLGRFNRIQIGPASMPRWLDSLRRSASKPPAGGGLSAAAGGTHSAADWAAWNVQRKPIAWLKPNPRNAKKHGPEQIAQLRAALRQFGWTMPVLARDDGMIIAGNGRVEAAKLEGITEAPVIIPAGWTADQFRAYALADNRIAENSDWDEELLALELADLESRRRRSVA